MSQTDMPSSHDPPAPGRTERALAAIGAGPMWMLDYLGGMTLLIVRAGHWLIQSLVFRRVRLGRAAIYAQIVRLGVSAIGVIMLMAASIGMILVLQMAPPLDAFGQVDQVARVNAVAVVRELGPLMTAIVLTGFAGASIAAELGTMVVGEEIEALEAHALNPIRFLVMPRLIATVVCVVVLSIFANLVAIAAGWLIGVAFLDISSRIYIDNTLNQLKLADLGTGLWKAGVFGMLIGTIACYAGINVSGGAAGVGRATTQTVVFSLIAIITSDLLFTAVFYALGWT